MPSDSTVSLSPCLLLLSPVTLIAVCACWSLLGVMVRIPSGMLRRPVPSEEAHVYNLCSSQRQDCTACQGLGQLSQHRGPAWQDLRRKGQERELCAVVSSLLSLYGVPFSTSPPHHPSKEPASPLQGVSFELACSC